MTGEAATAREALARVPAVRPDVAVLDVRPAEGGSADHAGVEVCRELRAGMPGLACLMLTLFDDDEALFDAIMAGAAGYVLKRIAAPTWWPPSVRWRAASPCWIRGRRRG